MVGGLKYFTDETGQKWEEVDMYLGKEIHIIRPAEPKWFVDFIHNEDERICGITVDIDVTEDQAQLIKEAVEALMGQILSDTHRLVLIDAITDARDALQKGAE